MNVTSPRVVAQLTSPALTSGLQRFVRARVPESEVDDIVQATLSDALVAASPPDEDVDIVRWVYGICRHKMVDWFRRMRREIPRDLEQEEGAPAESAPTSAMDLMRWARKELPAGKENEQTLEWMLREGAGEKLETIAEEEKVPAPRVRQRVSRLRRYFKAKWAAQMAAVAALVLVALAIAMALRTRKDDIVAPRPEPSVEPSNAPAPMLPPSLPAIDTNPSNDAAPNAPSDSAAPSASAPPRPVPQVTSMPTFNSKPPAPLPTKPSPKKGPSKAGPFSSGGSMSSDSMGFPQQLPLPPDDGTKGSAATPTPASSGAPSPQAK